MAYVSQRGRGIIFTPKDFLHLGTRPAIDTALSRLAAREDIRRLTRGLYDYPKQHPILGDLLPSLDDVAKAIAKDSGTTLQISGAKALHLLGLSTQVPAQVLYFTDGHSRDIKIGNAVLKLRHVSNKKLIGAGKKAGLILQAIRHVGKDRLNNTMMTKIANQLTTTDKQNLKQMVRYAPGWTKPVIDRLVV